MNSIKHLLLTIILLLSISDIQAEERTPANSLIHPFIARYSWTQHLPDDTIGKPFRASLADSLARMVKTDQIAASIPTGQYKALSREAWQQFKDSVFGTHQHILEVIFRKDGFPGYDLAGKEGSHHFWLMVQHCDKTPAFQEQVLAAMKTAVMKGNADAKDYAYLTDRVRLNTNRKQVYGTQVTYDLNICQALPRPLQDSLTVNERRSVMGLGPIEEYLNTMSSMHFEMNKDMYVQKGITQARQYIVPVQNNQKQ